MQITVLPSKLNGKISAPPSKSYMHRALICAAAADKKTKIFCNSFSKDIEATINCLRALGAKIDFFDDYVLVTPIDPSKDNGEECVLDCTESGSTLRFMLPFAAALGKKCKFIGAERLGKRPLAPLCDQLKKHGVKVTHSKDSFLPLFTEGKLSGTEFEIAGDISSQFITGLLFALGVTGGGSIKINGKLQSAPYIDITTQMQKKFGISAKKTEEGYFIAEGQSYKTSGDVVIEGDYSNAAFWLVAGAIGSQDKIECTNLLNDSLQGDSKAVDILCKMGAKLKKEKNSVTVYKSDLRGIEIDAADIPDIVPILCVAATRAEGVTTFKNIERLRAKESDRVDSTVNLITALGGKIYATENTIKVEKSTLSGGVTDSVNDHRIAMSAAIAALVSKGNVIINGAEAVSKSYPDFYDKFKELGGEVK